MYLRLRFLIDLLRNAQHSVEDEDCSVRESEKADSYNCPLHNCSSGKSHLHYLHDVQKLPDYYSREMLQLADEQYILYEQLHFLKGTPETFQSNLQP